LNAAFRYELINRDSGSAARRGVFHTPRGDVNLPAFMPVGTLAAVKGLPISMVAATGAEMVLSNTYHLALRPGEDIVQQMGGLHRFMGWDGPILTDSGGFQIFSLAKIREINEHGASFRSHIDGSLLELTPERAIAIQESLGSDIAMVLDHVTPLPCDDATVWEACQRTVRWAGRCLQASSMSSQAQFAIVQGGLNPDWRTWCAAELVKMNFPGYAIGGLSVGETNAEMYTMLDAVCPVLPEDKPRYLMGVGKPEDLLEAVRRGVDLFDCVMPTRNGRNALAFTNEGPLRMRNQKHARDNRPLEEDCPCAACKHSRSYLRHLFIAGEMLGPVLLSHHNLTYYQRLLQGARQAIEENQFVEYFNRRMAGWGLA